jgi:ribosomal protein S18 acetylase RimI-like enzyme
VKTDLTEVLNKIISINSLSIQHLDSGSFKVVTKLNLKSHQKAYFLGDSITYNIAAAYVGLDGLKWEPFAVLLDGNVIGTFTLIHNSDGSSVSLSGFIIDRDHQGKGYGVRCLSAICEALKQIGRNCLDLLVHKDNFEAISLYQKVGFVEVAKWKDQELHYRLDLSKFKKNILT